MLLSIKKNRQNCENTSAENKFSCCSGHVTHIVGYKRGDRSGFSITSAITPLKMNTSNNSSGYPKMSPVFVHTFTVLYLFIGIVGAFSNICILTVFFKVPKLRTKVNYFLASLAFSDLVFQCGILPIELEWHIRTVFRHSVTVCDFVYTLHFLALSCSCMNLLAVSGYRYLTICHPFVSKRITKKQVLVVVTFIWVYSTFTSLLPVMGWRSFPSSVINMACMYSYKPGFSLFIISVNWFFPALTVFVIYILVFRIARIQAKKIAKNEIILEHSDKKRRSYLLKGAISLAKIFAVYIICWLPFIINSFISQLPNIPYEKISMRQEYHYSIILLGYSNTAINPFLYAGLCEDFNLAYKRYFHRLSHAVRATFESARNALRNSVNRQSASSGGRHSDTVESPVRYVTADSRLSVHHVITMVSSIS